MNNPSVLIFTDWFEPGYFAGGPIRSIANLVKALEEDLQIYIYTSDRDFNAKQPYPGILVDKWQPYGKKSRVFYASPGYTTMKSVKTALKHIQPHTIYLNSMWSIPFTLWPLLITKKKLEIKVVLAPRGMLQKGAFKFKKNKKKIFVFILKLFKVVSHIHFHATDKQELEDIKSFFNKNNVSIISNYSSPLLDKVLYIDKQDNYLKIVFISRLSPKKNLLFVLKTLSGLSTTVAMTLNIYGPIEDKSYYDTCKKAAALLPEHITVRFLGPIEHHRTSQIIQDHHLFILPTKGENFGHAIFEALAVGRPVMISDQTPWKNLEKDHAGWDFPLNNAKLFKEKIIEIALMDQAEWEIWAKGAWDYAQEYLSNLDLVDKYKKLFS